MFDEYLVRWGLVADGDPIVTRSSRLLPVRQRDVPAVLKIALEAEEQRGGRLMSWWQGQGAARVLAEQDNALLLERAERRYSLAELSRSGRDDEATGIMCAVVAKLRSQTSRSPSDLVPLRQWFEALEPAAAKHGGVLTLSCATAHRLLATPRDVGVLHGDIHHGNILDFGNRGWLAIDPKGLLGELGFDYANIFCNPDHETATASVRFLRRLEVIVEAAGLDRTRLLEWILAWSGLSAAWLLDEHARADTALGVAELAAAQLSR
jgi:streptomycin 6-kinase